MTPPDIAQDKAFEAAFWDLIAQQRVYAAFDPPEYEAIFDRALGGRLEGRRILDVGSASGVSAALLAARGASVVGIDISPGLIAQAQRLWQAYGERIAFSVGDAEALAYPDGTFDCCFFGGVLHHFPDRAKVYVEALRVLKPGGMLLAIEPNCLDLMERVEWAVAGWRGRLSSNEAPLNPHRVAQEIEARGYRAVEFWTTRHDIPVLNQFPLLNRFFSRQRGFAIKTPVLRMIDRFRPPDHRGTFFVVKGIRP
jgi:SAM-dependent methyltransferase